MPRLAPVTSARLPLMPRSRSVRLDAGTLHDGGPAVEFRWQHGGKLVGRAHRDVPSLRDKIVRDLRHAHYLVGIRMQLAYDVRRHSGRTEQAVPGPCLEPRIAGLGDGREIRQKG